MLVLMVYVLENLHCVPSRLVRSHSNGPLESQIQECSHVKHGLTHHLAAVKYPFVRVETSSFHVGPELKGRPYLQNRVEPLTKGLGQ